MFFAIRQGCPTLQRTDDVWFSIYRSQSMALSETLGSRPAVDGVKKQLANAVVLQRVPEVQPDCGIRDILLQKADPHKFSHGIYGVFYALVSAPPALSADSPASLARRARPAKALAADRSHRISPSGSQRRRGDYPRRDRDTHPGKQDAVRQGSAWA